jgi:hypothetical protein
MVDLPKFLREMKYLKVAMRGLLSAEQHNFCSRHANNAMGDDADEGDDLVDTNKKKGANLLNKKKEEDKSKYATFIVTEQSSKSKEPEIEIIPQIIENNVTADGRPMYLHRLTYSKQD